MAPHCSMKISNRIKWNNFSSQCNTLTDFNSNTLLNKILLKSRHYFSLDHQFNWTFSEIRELDISEKAQNFIAPEHNAAHLIMSLLFMNDTGLWQSSNTLHHV